MAGAAKCSWCRRPLDTRDGPGRPRQFCKPSCRQMAYLQRQRAAELGLGEAELIVTRRELDELRDAIYVVECAVEDVERDMAESDDDPAELRRALAWLLQAVRPLVDHPPLTAP